MKDNSTFLLVIIVTCFLWSSHGFTIIKRGVSPQFQRPGAITVLRMSESGDAKGDPLREATGIRPSLHPITINAIAEALKARAVNKMPMRVTDTVKPIEVALSAGKIASAAITQRRDASKQDGMTFLVEEEQTIAGRVLGVVMRLDGLETDLYTKVSSVSWIAKYNEWATFGVLADETEGVDVKIKDDPLFCLSRAECLLALFLNTVEIPQLAKSNSTVPDGSKIDFLDSDRAEVLFSE